MRTTDGSEQESNNASLRRSILHFVLGIVGVLVVVMPIRAMIQDATEGFAVDSRFTSYYSTRGGEDLFGEPISNAFVDDKTGNVVQYFANTRLELEQDFSGNRKVTTSPLGMMLGNWDPPLSSSSEEQGCRFFHETGHHVCHAFLDFYEKNGGPDVFGYPISELKIVDDRMVQYFQRFRLDWFAEEQDQPVRPGPLGKYHLTTLDRAGSETEDSPTRDVMGLIIVSSVEHASVYPNDSQKVYLLVMDQNHEAIEGAAATLIAHFPDGNRMIIMPLTNRDGRSQVTLSFEDQPPGFRISLDITVVYNGLMKEARESFMIYLHHPD
jgi:hypothetical protein